MADPVFTFAESVPEPGNPTLVSGCSVCGADIEYSGRGRRSTRCPEHRRGAASVGSGASSAVLDAGVESLAMVYGVAGMALQLWEPRIGVPVFLARDDLASSYRQLIRTNKRFRKLLTDVNDSAAYLPIIIAHGKIAAAIWQSMHEPAQTESTDDSD